MSDEIDYEALAGVLGETIVHSPAGHDGSGPPPDMSGALLRYFGDYVLEDEIARGGMGVVYRARQVTLNRTVAVKVLRDTAFAGGEEVERFKVEAGAAAALRHPHIVGIHEIGEHGGTHFFSMDYLPGPTLAQLLRDGPLPARKAAALAVKIAQAIQHAHSQGVLHRDLKPANVLLDAAGEPVVTDFGLAKHDAADMGLTVSGQVLGTPAYMAPEQAEGRTRESDARTDVYGLGALLYHMASGRPPFTGDSHLAILTQVTKDEPVSVRLLNPFIPRDLETICAKAMSKDAPRRYQTAQELADDVQRFLDGKPVHARPVGALEKTWRWARRHRALAASLAAVVLLTLGVLITILISRSRIEGLRSEAVTRLYASDMRLALQNVSEDKYGAAAALLDRYENTDNREDLRGFEWYLARHLSRSNEAASLEPLTGQVAAVAWSPDGRWIAAAAQNLRVWEVLEGRTVLRHTIEAPAYALAFSPDSARFAVSRVDGEVVVCESTAPDKILFTGRFPASPQAVAWRTDGTALEIMAPHWHWRWETGKSEPMRVGSLGGLSRVAFLNASARRGLCLQSGPAGGDGWQIAVHDMERGTPFAIARTPNDRMPKCMACSGDNRWLVIGDFTGRIALLETPFTKRAWEVQAHRSMVDQAAISPDASLVASAGDHVIHLRGRPIGTLRRVLRGHHTKISALTFSPDGAWLLSGDKAGEVKRWSVEATAAENAIPENAAVSTSADGAALCWNVSAQQVRLLPRGGEARTFDVDPRGKERHVFHSGVMFQASGAAGEKNPLSIYSVDAPPAEWTVPGKLTGCSPDGNWITYTDSTTGSTMLVDRGNRRAPVPLAHGWLVSPSAFSADSRRCAIGDQRGRGRVFDTATGGEICTVAAGRGTVRGKALSADGSVLATAGYDGVAKLWDVPSGKLRREFRGSADTLWSVTLSPDGSRLAAGTGESTVILWDTATGLETGEIALGGDPAPVEFLVFMPDGAALIANGRVLRAPASQPRDP